MFSTIFTPSASVTFSPIEQGTAFALPAVDASNLDIMVTNNNAFSSVSLGWGVGALPAGLTVPPNVSVLLTANAATLAACAVNPLVVSSGAGPSNATAVTAAMPMRGGTITISRGTALSRPSF